MPAATIDYRNTGIGVRDDIVALVVPVPQLRSYAKRAHLAARTRIDREVVPVLGVVIVRPSPLTPAAHDDPGQCAPTPAIGDGADQDDD